MANSKQREIVFLVWDEDTTYGYQAHGYQLRQVKWHPNCNKRGYVLEHRLVMERHIGMYLPKHAIIHHKNGVKCDNRIENLEYIEEQSRHAKRHDRGTRNPNGQFVAKDKAFHEKKFRLLNKDTGLMQIFTLQKLISTTFRNSKFAYRGTFTGLKDKTGKDIFEGDIVLIEDYYTEPILDDGSGPQTRENHFGIVTFRDGMFGFLSDGKGDYFEKGFSSFETMAGQVGLEELEIIGNVHANPELLEVSNG